MRNKNSLTLTPEGIRKMFCIEALVLAGRPALITLPESTPLILRAERGSWYYASTFQNTPVWIPRTDAQPL